jgi:uncharacterized SAM-binding protein YcdF (DUF218 family)
VASTIAIAAFHSDPGPADVAVVLGAAVSRGRATPVFEERIRHGINLVKQGVVKKVLFTGGVGSGDRVAEAEVGRRVALDEGLSSSQVLTETRSRTTWENLAWAVPILKENDLTRVLIVSDPLHMKRALAMARDLGLDAHSSPTPTSRYRSAATRWSFLVRETYFFLFYQLQWLAGRNGG